MVTVGLIRLSSIGQLDVILVQILRVQSEGPVFKNVLRVPGAGHNVPLPRVPAEDALTGTSRPTAGGRTKSVPRSCGVRPRQWPLQCRVRGWRRASR